VSVLPDDILAYQTQRLATQERMTSLGRGANSRASYALEISPTTVSRVIRGLEVSQPVLDSIDAWSQEEAARTSSAVLATAV